MNRKRKSKGRAKSADQSAQRTGGSNNAGISAALQNGLALHESGRLAEARAVYEGVLQKDPNQGDALHLLGLLAFQTNNFEAAVQLLGRAAAKLKRNAACFNTLGAAMQRVGRLPEAIDQYSTAIRLKPDYADALENRARALRALQRNMEAVADFERLARLSPGNAFVWTERGNCLAALGRLSDAISSYDRALECDMRHTPAHFGRANVLGEATRYAEAVEAYDAALESDQGTDYLPGLALHARMQIGEWEGFSERLYEIASALKEGKNPSHPFNLLSVIDDPGLHKLAADRYSRAISVPTRPLAERKLGTRLRIGYYSADFSDHATARLMVEMIEAHDRDKFEVIAFSFRPEKQEPLAKRIKAAFDKFIDASNLTDDDLVSRSRAMDIDIAVDLKGNTAWSRPRLFALRCAPLQLGYLGYPGSFAAGGIDYVLADNVVVPAGSEIHFTEQVIRLPQCYQPNDSLRAPVEVLGSRAEHGLPDDGVVFCSMNSPHKTLPDMFGLWMDILREVDDSVLWMLEGAPGSKDRLLAIAEEAGIDADRLMFAPKVSSEDHIARYAHADLFLDTFPYNAHTTASEALWAGLPVVTLAGQSFASRVGASLLTTLGMPELITETPEAYKALAIELGRNVDRRRALREKLTALRGTSPLFKGDVLARHIETAYQAIADRHNQGLPACEVSIREDGSFEFADG